MKNALKLALGAILLSAGFAFAQSQWRGDINLVDNSLGTSQYQVGGIDIVKSMHFELLDSLASNATVLAVLTLPRPILVQQIDIYTPDKFLGPDGDSAATVYIRNGSTEAVGTLDSGGTYSSTNMTDVAFSAVVCTVGTTDGGGTCTGGEDGYITIWYTDN